MRAGACAAQQTLSAEAAAVLKHSLSLARRRGHAQLTPLHVAATLLTSRSSLLRRACLKSQPPQHHHLHLHHHLQPSHHPLQCRALELCFNVALNRLPATPGPLLHAQPSLSNALIAALKRAQAHQRRGCIEQNHHHNQQQQPPLIAIKVELEQLILSILDDPSVSRVMREAGFSSTAVKSNLDDCTASSVFHCYGSSAAGGIYSTPSSPPAAEPQRPIINPTALWQAHFLTDQNPLLFSSPPHKKPPPLLSINDDVKLTLDAMLGRRKRNVVVVGDSSSNAEAVVAHLIALVERGEVPDEVKAAQVVKFQFSAVPLALMSKEEVDMNVADLKRKVDSFSSVGTVIVYIGDLKWTVDQIGDGGSGGGSGFSAVDHLIAEIGKLLAWYNAASNMKVWLMATANYQTYVKCQMKQPPLDLQWSLQTVSVPSGGLGLSLNPATSGRDSRIAFSENSSPVSEKRMFSPKEETGVVLTCCQECKSDYEKEALLLKSFSDKDKESSSPHLPYWLKPHPNQKEDLDVLRSKYNNLCKNLHQGRNKYYSSSSYPSWANKGTIFADSETISFAYPSPKPSNNHVASTLPRFRRQQSCHIEFSFSSNGGPKEPNLDSLKMMEDKEVKITLALGNSYIDEAKHRENVLYELLKENVPWQMEAISLIVEALKNSEENSCDKFLLLQGNDNVAKRRLALAVAESMCGSSHLLFIMNLRSNDKAGNRENLERALRSHEKLVVLVEDAEFADPDLAKFLENGFESENSKNGRDSGRAIFILSTDNNTNAVNVSNSVTKMKLVVQESTLPPLELPNLDHKRRVEWDSPEGRIKSRRSNEMEEVTSNATGAQLLLKKELSSNGLDLNIRADEDEAKEGNLSPISSDLTREITMDPPHNSSLTFLKKIKNRVVLNRGPDHEREAIDVLVSRFRKAFNEATRTTGSLKVEEKVLEQVLRGEGLYLNSSFEKWLKDVFRTSLSSLNIGERERVSVRLCLVGEGEGEGESAEDGYMGTCLPKRIQVSYIG